MFYIKLIFSLPFLLSQMIHVDQMSSRVPMADASRNAGFAIEMTIAATTVTKSHVHQPHVSLLKSSRVPRTIASRRNGGVTANQTVPMEMTKE